MSLLSLRLAAAAGGPPGLRVGPGLGGEPESLSNVAIDPAIGGYSAEDI